MGLIILHATILVTLFVDITTSTLPTYNGMCNKTINIDIISPGGRLVYTHRRMSDEHYCNIVIQSDPGSHIGFFFKNISAFSDITVNNDTIDFDCTSDYSHGCFHTNFPMKLFTTVTNTLFLRITGDDLTSFSFDLIFFTYHYNQCRSFEGECIYMMDCLIEGPQKPCLDYSLICDRQYDICSSSRSSMCGGDFTIGKPQIDINASLIAAIVLLAIIAAPFMIVVGCICARKCGCKKQSQSENVPRRVQDIFNALLDEARENGEYSNEAMDPSKFDPPPDYDSLENIGGACSTKSDLTEVSVIGRLPSYSDVMNNSSEYLVCSHM